MQSPFRIALCLAFVVAGCFASEAVREMVHLSRNPGVRVATSMLSLQVRFFCLAVGLACALPGSPRTRLGLAPARLPWSALLALVVGTLGLSAAVDGYLALSRAGEGSTVVGISRGLAHTPWSHVGYALMGTALAPALAEELLCRGLVQRSLARWAGPWLAVPVAALFFGWLHQEWVHGSIAFAIGLYFGVAALWADSTRPAIAAHLANNAVAVLGSVGLLQVRVTPEAALAGGPLLAIAGLVWAWRCRGRAPGEPGPAEEDPALLQPGPEPADP